MRRTAAVARGPEKMEEIVAPLSAGLPPLFDVASFSKWVTDVFTVRAAGF